MKADEYLKSFQINETAPGSLLHDVEVILEFIGSEGITTKSKQGNIPPSILPRINEALHTSINLELKRALLKHYPNITALFVILRSLGLLEHRIVRKKGSRTSETARIRINSSAMKRWKAMNQTERYFACLEAWVIHADPSVFASQEQTYYNQFGSVWLFLTRGVGKSWKTYEPMMFIFEFPGYTSTWNMLAAKMFGLIEVTEYRKSRSPDYPKGWLPPRARLTPFGDAMREVLQAFFETIRDEMFQLAMQLPDDSDFGFLVPAFNTSFPELKRIWPRKVKSFRDGLYIFKVALEPRLYSNRAYRKIAASAAATLDEMADAILDAFAFSDKGHLYGFVWNNQYGKLASAYHPGMEEGPSCKSVQIGGMGLRARATVDFNFDFGDNWEFFLKLEKVDPPDPTSNQVRVLESHGEPPDQYSSWD